MSAPASGALTPSAASTPAVGAKRRTHDAAAAAPSGTSNGAQPHSRISEAAPAVDASVSLRASAAAAASSPAATDPAAVAARKKQRHESSAVAAPHADSASADPLSRWSSLYSDALYSILQFTSLSDLSRVLAVSRGWSDAVITMQPIHAEHKMGDTFDEHRLDQIRDVRPLQPTDFPALRSRLVRHVSSFGSCFLKSVDCLEAVAQHMPWMRSLSFQLGMMGQAEVAPQPVISTLGRLRSLTHLAHLDARVGFRMDAWDADAFNSVIAAIGGMSMLESVRLCLRQVIVPRLSFAPLIALQSLHTLSIRSADFDLPPCTDAQVAEFRRMRSIKILQIQSQKTDFYVRMLQPGHALQWTQLPPMTEVTEPLAPLLSSLPTLTELHVFMRCPNVSFFSQLPHLTNVAIAESSGIDPAAAVDPAALVRALSHCAKLRSLRLNRVSLTSAHLATLLSRFSQLAELRLEWLSAVDSLRCLDTPALAASLAQLNLHQLGLCPSSDVVHLLNLRSLERLCVRGLSSPLSSDLLAQFVAGSPRFPHLAHIDLEKEGGAFF